MRPIPVVFHLGPLQVHTYGIGLALTFWFALWYMRRRFDANGLPSEWLNRAFLWVVGAAIVGARVVHVIANISYYWHDPIGVFAVWHGGLSSFGGLLGGIPVALWFKHRYLPRLRVLEALDIAAPVLMASWALGRLLGPQLMIDGGGHPTKAWFGMRYACTLGKVGCLPSGISVREIPVPIFQSIECFAIFLVLRYLENVTRRQPPGVVLAGLAALWGMARFNDEFLWLATPRLWDAVEVTGLVLAAAGWATLGWMLLRRGRRRAAGLAEDLAPGTPPDAALGLSEVALGTPPEAGGRPGPELSVGDAGTTTLSAPQP